MENKQKIGFESNILNNSPLFTKNPKFQKRSVEAMKNGEFISMKDLESLLNESSKYTLDKMTMAFITKSNKVKVFTGIHTFPRGLNILKADYVYVDCSEILYYDKKTGKLNCRDYTILNAYLYSALVRYSMDTHEATYMKSNTFITLSTEIFVNLFSFAFDYLYKLSSTIDNFELLKLVTGMYFNVRHLGVNIEVAFRTSMRYTDGLSTIVANNFLKTIEERSKTEEPFKDIFSFFRLLNDTLIGRTAKKAELGVFLHKWVSLYGEGTHFALESLYSFLHMILLCHENAYANVRNKTVERNTKIVHIDGLMSVVRKVVNDAYAPR